jgi:hypothetical protein
MFPAESHVVCGENIIYDFSRYFYGIVGKFHVNNIISILHNVATMDSVHPAAFSPGDNLTSP